MLKNQIKEILATLKKSNPGNPAIDYIIKATKIALTRDKLKEFVNTPNKEGTS